MVPCFDNIEFKRRLTLATGSEDLASTFIALETVYSYYFGIIERKDCKRFLGGMAWAERMRDKYNLHKPGFAYEPEKLVEMMVGEKDITEDLAWEMVTVQEKYMQEIGIM